MTKDITFKPGDFRYAYFDAIIPREVYIEKVDALRQFVPVYACSLAALAIKFAMHHPGVASVLSNQGLSE